MLFQPETERVVVGQKVNKQGKIAQKYVVAKSLVKDVVFEETYDTSLQPEASGGEGGNGSPYEAIEYDYHRRKDINLR